MNKFPPWIVLGAIFIFLLSVRPFFLFFPFRKVGKKLWELATEVLGLYILIFFGAFVLLAYYIEGTKARILKKDPPKFISFLGIGFH